MKGRTRKKGRKAMKKEDRKRRRKRIRRKNDYVCKYYNYYK